MPRTFIRHADTAGHICPPAIGCFPGHGIGMESTGLSIQLAGLEPAGALGAAPVRTISIFFALCVISVVIGLLWNKKRWIIYAALFWGIYIVLFTSIFTNWQGFFVGTVGALGYWLQQQGVHRGGQPWYYYLLIQIPIYEFLPALGVLPGSIFWTAPQIPCPSRLPPIP